MLCVSNVISVSEFRWLAACANHLSLGCPDMLCASEEACWSMSRAQTGTSGEMSRLARYLLQCTGMACKFYHDGHVGKAHWEVHSDSEFWLRLDIPIVNQWR